MTKEEELWIKTFQETTSVIQEAKANADTIRYWSRAPGDFLDPISGEPLTGLSFEGTIKDWYETLVPTMLLTIANHLQKHEISGTNEPFILASPHMCMILEHTIAFNSRIEYQNNDGLDKYYRFFGMKLFKDPYFCSNLIMVGIGDFLSQKDKFKIHNCSLIKTKNMNVF